MNAPRGNPSPTTRPGISSFAYQTYKATLAAGAFLPVTITGNYVRCVSSNLSSFKLGIDGMPTQFFTQGLKVTLPPGASFAEIDLDNTGNAAPLTVTLAIGSGDLDDSRVSGTVSVSSAVGVNAIPGRVNVTNVAVQLDATAGRQSITVQNLDPAESIYLGKDNTVTAATGYPLGPGQDITIDHSNGPIWAISNVAAGVATATLVEV